MQFDCELLLHIVQKAHSNPTTSLESDITGKSLQSSLEFT